MKANRTAFIRCACALSLTFLITLSIVKGEPPPQFPRVQGVYQMTRDWRVSLPEEYAKRFEQNEHGSDLVLWRTGITCWTSIYGRKEGETPATTYDWIKQGASKNAIQTFKSRDTKPLRFGYLLHEQTADGSERWALYTHSIGVSGYVLMAIYFDDQRDIETAKKIWFSIVETR